MSRLRSSQGADRVWNERSDVRPEVQLRKCNLILVEITDALFL